MWGGAGAKKREDMRVSESSTGKERGNREGDCMQWGVQERGHIALFTAWGAALLREDADMWASTATDDRCQREEDGCRYDSYLSGIDEEEIAGWGRVCHWTDGEECDSPVLLCYSFSYSCTDPGWVYSGSPSCRGSGPSPTPSSSGPSSHSAGLISLHASLRCNAAQSHYIIPANGGARQRLSLLSIAVCTHIRAHSHTYGTQTGERRKRSLL